MAEGKNADLVRAITAILEALTPIQSELSLPQIIALLWIAREPGLSVNELSERLGCPQQTASRHVSALLGRYQNAISESAQGSERSRLDPLIEQKISEDDSRSRALFLSQHGKKLIAEITASVRNA